ncbi:hypothetical protein sS8_5414 [Methylocaldum marinum]|uniref:Uncharacterized protein n=1 Tax=Methylocaldum marinum TaxID=1432792 RepID=A0A250L1L4_9GAMM|nr:hypothetical protein [Methylocaldum marinum]BBA37331.1 hypothetical protein sS8_5414 [Methylocaldum marinum]
MAIHWNAELPEDYSGQAVVPVTIQRRVDDFAHASKEVGFDDLGARCFYRHEFTLTEDRFDADEFPIEVGVYWERVIAWRLTGGKWLKLKVWSDRLDHCPRRYIKQAPELVEEHELER